MDETKTMINVNELLSSFSLLLDISEKREFQHSKRTAYIALRLAESLGLDESTRENIYYSAILHDIGMAGKLSDYSLQEFDLRPDLVKLHTEIGKTVTSNIPFSKAIPEIVACHHEQWNGQGPWAKKENEIPLESQIIFLADRFDVHCLRRNSLQWREQTLSWVHNNSGSLFNPAIVHALDDLGKQEKFWLDYSYHNTDRVLVPYMPAAHCECSLSLLQEIAKAFAALIDSKSHYTHAHSLSISRMASRLASQFTDDQEIQMKIGIAGYLHDLGKVSIPNAILDKPGRLNPEEWTIMKSHVYYTKLALQQVKGLEDIARWAGNHHEKISGTGYPEGLREKELSDFDQIIAVCDIFQALTEERPYRPGLSNERALEIMNQMVKDGELRPSVFRKLEKVL